MWRRSRKVLTVSAAMLSVLSVAFSCSYGDDEDDDKDDKKVEAIPADGSQRAVLAVTLADLPLGANQHDTRMGGSIGPSADSY
jgi:hypothetical protein